MSQQIYITYYTPSLCQVLVEIQNFHLTENLILFGGREMNIYQIIIKKICYTYCGIDMQCDRSEKE